MELVNSYKEISCPATGATEKIYYRYITETEFIEIFGCDSSNGSSTCQNCLSQIREELMPK